ncbi:ArsR family transcriptional regulator [Aquabacterium sp. A7-Y]|uniref:ArsR/SmtB family transcription factor n=1 Tax=Aquabacterium sp. A7-Y TaxID=1349605 RepID=UPI00223D51BE|nr:helix-turn-helix transcriptional regulator [Aquabacterium sp. A7-Y]MCW7539222.1 ArsR family transcriptional regulator [Aquabacterium sp. A7-Y]
MDADTGLPAIAAAIAEPARANMLCALLDGRARTATELAAVGEVGASTASAHLARLVRQELVYCLVQGKHRYYRLAGAEVAAALEALLVLAGTPRKEFRPRTPAPLRSARSCYDHMAGAVAVALLQALTQRGWLVAEGSDYALAPDGATALEHWGVDVEAARRRRRRFACGCVDWSERQPHLGGALGAALLGVALERRWVSRELDSRGLRVSPRGWRDWLAPLDIRPDTSA